MRKINFWLITVLFLVLGITTGQSQTATTPSGDGSEGSPFQISSLENLYWLMQTSTVWNAGYYFEQTANIDASASAVWNDGAGATPIGSTSYAFNGIYDGKGHTISGLSMTKSSSYAGLFGYTNGAKIKNLGLTEAVINGSYYTAAIAGYINYTTLSNCYATGSVSGKYVGGFTGYSKYSKIENCYFNGIVTGSNKYNGGILGYSYRDTINSSYAIGSIIGTSYTGGLVGYSTSSEDSACYFSGSVECSGSYTGGLIGFAYTTKKINNCYANGDISGTSYTGGLIGFGGSNTGVKNVYFVGSVSGSSYVGGLIGCTSENYSTTVTKGYVYANVSGSSGVGLVIGNNTETTVEDIYYCSDIIGDVTGSGSITATGLSLENMKKQLSYSAFDFSGNWAITEATTFPCLQAVYNLPVITAMESSTIKINESYTSTLECIGMDNTSITFSLEDAPEGMTLSGSTLSWTPDATGSYTATIVATDGNGGKISRIVTFNVITFSGSGTEKDPYGITTIDELYQVRDFSDKCFVLMNDLDFYGSAYSAENSDEGWSPITFAGSFNGKGHTISNLFINSASTSYAGLFGTVTGGIIDSLGVVNCTISAKSYIGCLAGYCKECEISDCYATGEVTGNASYSGYTSGLIGLVESSTATDVYAVVTVANRANYTAGLFAYVKNSSVSNAFTIADLSGEDDFIGGITGGAYNSSISSVYAQGNINTSNSYVGGLAGQLFNGSKITNAYSAMILSVGESSALIGGLVGYVTSTTDTINCAYTTGVINGTYDAGSIAGVNNGALINTYFNSKTATVSWGASTDNNNQNVKGLTTSEMKSISNFTGFSDTAWTITAGTSFPALHYVYDYPIIFPVDDDATSANSAYNVSVTSIPMDYDLDTVVISDPEDGMLLADGKFSWTPVYGNIYTITVLAEDTEGASVSTSWNLEVNSFVGDGSEADPYQISTIGELNLVRNYADSNFILMNELDFSGSEFDAENSNEGWEPITSFTGSFNGKGHIIKNLYINRPEDEDGSMGLFGEVSDTAVIDSLSLTNCFISGYKNVGGIAGKISSSSINNSSVSGNVYCEYRYAGGFAGQISNSTVTACYSTANVNCVGRYVGGIAGYTNSCIINSASASGDIYGTGSDAYYCGGLLGYSTTDSVRNSYATGSIYTIVKNVGGLIGLSNSNTFITNCYAIGNCTGSSRVGGLIGRNTSGTIEKAYSLGKTKAASDFGGFIGYNESEGIITEGFYNMETSEMNVGIGSDENSQIVTGLTDVQSKQSDYYTNFNFETVWAIQTNTTYPVLQGVNNAPFTFADTIAAWYRLNPAELLSNDYDYENLQEGLVAHVDSVFGGSFVNGIVYFNDTISNDDTVKVFYRAGEIIASTGDTLLGNEAMAIVFLANTENVSDTLTTDEDSVISFSLSRYEALHTNNWEAITEASNGTVAFANDSLVYTPATDFNGTDNFEITFTNSVYTDTVEVFLVINAVNDAPVISSTASTTAYVGSEYTYTVSASDVDSEVLTYSLSNSPEGMTITANEISWTPSTGTTTSGEVTLTVSDDLLTATEIFTITVTDTSSSPEPDASIDAFSSASEGISAYPNPANGNSVLTLNTNNTKGGLVSIYNITGKMVMQQVVAAGSASTEIDIEDLNSGLYMLRFTASNGQISMLKLVK